MVRYAKFGTVDTRDQSMQEQLIAAEIKVSAQRQLSWPLGDNYPGRLERV